MPFVKQSLFKQGLTFINISVNIESQKTWFGRSLLVQTLLFTICSENISTELVLAKTGGLCKRKILSHTQPQLFPSVFQQIFQFFLYIRPPSQGCIKHQNIKKLQGKTKNLVNLLDSRERVGGVDVIGIFYTPSMTLPPNSVQDL